MCEHLEERISERVTCKLNQPNQRGYLLGCHQRGTQGVGKNGYSVKTLMGNWSEEQADLRYNNRRPHLVSDEERKLNESRVSVTERGGNTLREKQGYKADQLEMAGLMNKEKTIFPGHQPVLIPGSAPQWHTEMSKTYTNPKVREEPPKNSMQGKALSPIDRDLMLVSKIRTFLLQNGGDEGFRKIRRMLAVMDLNQNGQLCIEELSEGLMDYGVQLGDEEMRLLFNYFDRDRSGQISITEFLDGIRGPMNQRRAALVRTAFKQLKKIHGSELTLEKLVESCDMKYHPLVESEQVGVDEMRGEFAASWDFISPDCEVTMEHFVSYYNDISSGITNEQYFEYLIRNSWHISGGQGAGRNISCKRVRVTHKNGLQTLEEVKNDLAIAPGDMDAIRQNLIDQGIIDISKIELDC
eukprot:TRINITY_DN26944_c0_g1_i1.p1 TRINITY_DN26944_c0_g1~~TRINITY_DN26944_c0_g1_i1.p1  ORF type:complete len:428 (+),score=79.57 TRINITY_DN26944_c0_g1_i1:54-1286(+)